MPHASGLSAADPAVIEAMLDQADAALGQGQLDQAQAGLEAVLKLDPRQFDALLLLGVVAMQRGDLNKAAMLMQQAIDADPSVETAHQNLGLIWLDMQQADKALACFDKAIALDADYTEAHFGRGLALQALKRWPDAAASFRLVVQRQPQNVEALFNLGTACLEGAQFESAVDCYGRVLAQQPSHVSALINAGHAFLALQRHAEAIACYDKALTLQADRPGAYAGRADACMALFRFDEALVAYEKALALEPERMDLLANRGNALLKLRRVDEAIVSYRQALGKDARHPDVLSNLAGALREARQWDEALAQCELALAARSPHAGAIMNRGNVMLDLGRLTQAREDFAQVTALQPSNADAHWAHGWAAALQGDWAVALPLFEWRWKKATFTTPSRGFKQPLWLGAAPLQGKTILLHAEQGLGDTIQFGRYAREVKALGARVLLEVQPALKTLISTLDAGVEVLAQGVDALPAFDYHCPVMSLPLAFKATPSTVPAMPAYLHADPDRVRAWGERLGAAARPRVGLVWSGNAAHRDDHHRSMALAQMLQALPPGLDLYVLQKDIRDSDMATLQAHPNVVHMVEALQNVDDTAALLTHMDVIVSVDTAMAHLAGALGKPVCILLAKMPDWRWLLIRSDSPWYPSARLFRQVDWGQWDQPLKAMRQHLQGLLR